MPTEESPESSPPSFPLRSLVSAATIEGLGWALFVYGLVASQPTAVGIGLVIAILAMAWTGVTVLRTWRRRPS